MKKIFALLIVCFAITSIQAQDVTDALRYSQNDLSGTARFKAMSGAFGALGGDFSAININPAGSVVFANNQIGFTLSNNSNSNSSNYFGSNSSDSKNNFNIGQAGGVFVFYNSRNTSKWKKFAFAINYENSKNLNNSITSAGTNPKNSVDSYFLNYANGLELQVVNGTLYNYSDMLYNEQQAYLGYNAYIIDPAATGATNTSYYTNVAPGTASNTVGNYYQTNSIKTLGYNGKLAFNFSGQYTDKFSFGINLNSHFSDFRQSSRFTESNNNAPYTTGSTVDYIRFNNDLYTVGSGFSFQIGGIFKPVKEVRLGFAYESPTWYKFTDEVTQSVVTSGYGINNTSATTYTTGLVTDPNTTMIFQPYNLRTPGKLTGSFAYVFAKKGLISLDVAMKDYSKMQYKPNSDFPYTNPYMSKNLTNTTEVRLGGEYKIQKWSLRAGYRYEQTPYKNKDIMGNLTGYSGGFGYNFGATKLDLSYNHSQRNYAQQFFNVGMTDAATINTKLNNVALTLLFEL